jgi:MFS family permease
VKETEQLFTQVHQWKNLTSNKANELLREFQDTDRLRIKTTLKRSQLLWRRIGMLIALSYLTYAFSIDERNSAGVLVALIVYIAFFAASYAPVMWVVISEIDPVGIKGFAMSFSTAVSWGCTFVMVYFEPIIRAEWGDNCLFAIFGGFTLFAFIFVKTKIPETKGKTPKQIEKELTQN